MNASAAALDVDVAAGDKLRFTVDCEVDMNGLENVAGGHRGHLAVEAVQRSQLSITVKNPTSLATARCPLKGNGITEGKSGSRLYYKGLVVSCEVPIAQAGKHAVSASVVWDPAIKPLSAKAVVRRVR